MLENIYTDIFTAAFTIFAFLLGLPLAVVFGIVFAIIKAVAMFVLFPVGALIRFLIVDTIGTSMVLPFVDFYVKYILEPIFGAIWGTVGSNMRLRTVLHVDMPPQAASALNTLAGSTIGRTDHI